MGQSLSILLEPLWNVLFGQSLQQLSSKAPEDVTQANIGCNAATNATATLLQLPVEIRLHIYGHAFEDIITITSSLFPEPVLLSVCRSIREEAGVVLYRQRKFEYEMSDNLSTSMMTALQKALAIQREFDVTIDLAASSSSTRNICRNWSTELVYLRRVYTLFSMEPSLKINLDRTRSKTESTVDNLLFAMIATVDELRDLPWLRVERILELQYDALASVDRG